MLSVDEAKGRILALAGALPPREVALEEALGLVLAGDVVAGRALPPFDNSAMDGFAVRAGDLRQATPSAPVRLRLAGEVAAGHVFPGEMAGGTAVRIMTGAPIPAGADAVIEVEETTTREGVVEVRRAPELGRSLRRSGTDIRAGDIALKDGAHIGPAQIALLAALGVATPRCIPRPLVAVLATGDELVDHTVEPGPAQVTDIVGPAIGAAVESVGAVPRRLRRAADTEADVKRALADAAGADVVVSVGGVSMGEYDLVRKVIEEAGDLDFWKVAMRPGKPLAVGTVNGIPLLGLPGNPVSALVAFEVFVVPMLLAMSGRPDWARPRVTAELADALHTPEGLRTFARAHLEPRAGRPPMAHPAAAQSSYQLRALAAANALLDIGAEEGELAKGAMVQAILIDQPPGPAL